jgi:hypothetical protein
MFFNLQISVYIANLIFEAQDKPVIQEKKCLFGKNKYRCAD